MPATPRWQTAAVRPAAQRNQWVGGQPVLTQKVNEKTTILDMVRWNTKSNIDQAGDAIVLGAAAGNSYSGLKNINIVNNKTEINLGLDLGQQMSPGQRMQAEKQGKQAVARMLNNTISEYRLQGTPAEAHIRQAIARLERPFFRMTVKALADMTKEVSEAVHAEASKKLGASAAAREAGRMPMECMTHLASEIRQARSTATPEQRERLNMVAESIKDRVLRHRLTFQETRDFLAHAEKDFQKSGLRDLSALARNLRADIPDPTRAGAYQTRLHDNIYGRAMESVLMAELVHNPPANVKTCMGKMGTTLASVLNTQPLASQEATALDMQNMLRQERRAWQAQSPALERFINAPTPREALIALKAFLQAPMHTGIDCIAIPYAAIKLSVCMQNRNGYAVEWMSGANRMYGGVVNRAAARITETAANPNRMIRKADITMHHQPAIVKGRWMEAVMHPADRNRPDLSNATPEVKQALQHGIAYASGISGTTNIIMHMVDAFKKRGIDIDAKDAMLGTMMFINYDGGHSMHEALWVGNQLDRKLGLGLGMPGADPKTFVSDYKQFIDSFPTGKGGEQLKTAADKAWNSTLDYFRQHSHYAQRRT
ncbi:hypothetical protein [Noviherbaspirillum aerium]|uniref:hypothetical protein n=1 Tax=Noviherbaspirillum aerium TaxID=2588497 RepID=UPI00124E5644|nr:hypothetical protein [Noviherbaspirillum aerium]